MMPDRLSTGRAIGLVVGIAILLVLAIGAAARADLPVPCGDGSAKQVARCVYRDIRGGVPGGWSEVKRVVSCESGWNPRSGGAHGRYAGLYQEEAVEHRSWSIPGADVWMRQLLRSHPNLRSAKNRLDPLAASIVTLSHVAGPDGWSYLGPDCG